MSGIFAQDEWYWLPCAAETKKFKVPIVLATLCRGFLHKTSGTGCRARLRGKKSKSRLYWLAYVGDFCPRRVGGWVGGTGCRASERIVLAGWLATTMSNIKAICHVMV